MVVSPSVKNTQYLIVFSKPIFSGPLSWPMSPIITSFYDCLLLHNSLFTAISLLFGHPVTFKVLKIPGSFSWRPLRVGLWSVWFSSVILSPQPVTGVQPPLHSASSSHSTEFVNWQLEGQISWKNAVLGTHTLCQWSKTGVSYEIYSFSSQPV